MATREWHWAAKVVQLLQCYPTLAEFHFFRFAQFILLFHRFKPSYSSSSVLRYLNIPEMKKCSSRHFVLLYLMSSHVTTTSHRRWSHDSNFDTLVYYCESNMKILSYAHVFTENGILTFSCPTLILVTKTYWVKYFTKPWYFVL